MYSGNVTQHAYSKWHYIIIIIILLLLLLDSLPMPRTAAYLELK